MEEREIGWATKRASVSTSLRALANRFSSKRCDIHLHKILIDRTRWISASKKHSAVVKRGDTHPHISPISLKIMCSQRGNKYYFLSLLIQFIFWEDIAYKSRTTRVTLLSILDIARHYVPALFSTNHQWTHRRLGTACSGPTSGPSTARQSRARRTIDFVWTRWFWWTICS